MGDGRNLQKNSAPLSLIKTHRMTPLSAKSISLDSTFKPNRRNFNLTKLTARGSVADPGSGIRKKPIPDPGSRGQKAPDPGSATLIVLIV